MNHVYLTLIKSGFKCSPCFMSKLMYSSDIPSAFTVNKTERTAGLVLDMYNFPTVFILILLLHLN